MANLKLDVAKLVRANAKTLRTQRGISRDTLAKLSGLSKKTIQRIETGTNPTLRNCTVSQLAKGLGVSEQDLLTQNLTITNTQAFTTIKICLDGFNIHDAERLKNKFNLSFEEIFKLGVGAAKRLFG